MTRRVIILGSTGSIGRQTLDVIEHLNALHQRGQSAHRFDVVGLAAASNVNVLSEQAATWPSARIAIAHQDVRELAIGEHRLGASFPGRLLRALHGSDAPERLVREVDCDLVVAAIVGVAGLAPTLAAVELGRDVALANKETLVAAGALVTSVARKSGSKLLPVDSEHSALWQCLLGAAPRFHSPADPPLPPGAPATTSIRRAILTASGGPFREWSRAQLSRATPADALKHPTWAMGPKITIDCATLMNKSLELIEAHWLFGLRDDQLGMLVHPQSIVHAMVETTEGAILAQLGSPDMRTPIQFALSHPDRHAGKATPLDLTTLSRLDFAPVDTLRFPAADAWTRVLGDRAHSTAGAILNAANEDAVRAFLDRRAPIPFPKVSELALAAVDSVTAEPADSLDSVLRADRLARRFVREHLSPSPARP